MMQKHNIIFVCTGNTCRSPMAQAAFEELLHERGLGEQFNVSSAGVAASLGDAASSGAVAAMAEKGIDLSSHRSQPLTLDDAHAATLLVCMTNEHKRVLMQYFDESKIRLLGNSIADPYGAGVDVYRKCRDQIMQSCEQLLEEILSDD